MDKYNDEAAQKAINATLEQVGDMEYQILEARVLRKLQEELTSSLAERDAILVDIQNQRKALQEMVSELMSLDTRLEKESGDVCTHFAERIAMLQTKYTDHLKRERARIRRISSN